MFSSSNFENFKEYGALDKEPEVYFDPVNPLGAVKFHILKDGAEDSWHPTEDDPPDLTRHSFGGGRFPQGVFSNVSQENNQETTGNTSPGSFGMSCFPSRSEEEWSTLQARIDRASVDVYKKADLERISTDEAINRAKRLADLKTEREFQTTELFLGKDGTVRLCKRSFFGRAQMEPSFKIEPGFVIYCCVGMEEKIFHATFKTATGKQCHLFLRLSDVCEKTINRKLNALGVHFGLSNKKEKEARLLMINELIEWADEVLIPYQLGWNKEDGVWSYVLPGELNWKEIEAYV